MRFKRLIAAILSCLMAMAATAQEPPRANIIAYEDENDIEKLRYTASPYYMALDNHWQRNENDTAVEFSRQIEVAKWWKGYNAYLNIRTTGACHVIVGTTIIDTALDGQNLNEFNLSPQLKLGKTNTITVTVLKHSDADHMDAALPRRSPAIDGTAFILLEPQVHIHDYVVLGSGQHRTSSATLSLSVDLSNPLQKGKYYLEVEIWDPQGHQFDKMGKWAVFNKRSTLRLNLEAEYPSAQLWNAENPNLYTLVLRLRDEKMQLIEVLGTRFGFRSVEVNDGLLCLNGQPITIRGTIYNAANADGEYSTIQIRQDLLQMKRNGFNAIRTAYHSPADWRLYELCDQLGLYVVCDANLHPLSTKMKAVATDRDYSTQFVQRVTNMYGRYKNHTSIIMWSLGNCTDNGICMEDAYKALKGLDVSRPTLFSGAQYSTNTDIIAPQDPTPESIKQFVSKPQSRPLIVMSSQSVAEGNYAEFDEIWQLIRDNASVQGAFVSNWLPVTIVDTETSSKHTLPGLLKSSRYAKPSVAALRHLFRPCEIRMTSLTPDQGEFEVQNIADFGNLSSYSLDYTICTNHKPNIVEGDLPLNLNPGESERFKLRLPQLTLYPDEELFIRFSLRARRATAYYTANTLIDEVEFALPANRFARKELSSLNKDVLEVDSAQIITIKGANFEITVDSASGNLLTYSRQGTQATIVPTMTLLKIGDKNSTPMQTTAVSYTKPDPYTFCIERLLSSSVGADVHQSIVVLHSGDIIITIEIPKSGKKGLYIVGELANTSSYDSVTWFGNDRYVCFPSNNGALTGINKVAIGRFADTADGGSRDNVRWLSLFDQTEGLYVDFADSLFSFTVNGSALTYTIPISNDTTTLTRCHLRRYECYENEPYDFYRIAYPQHTSVLTEMPVITAENNRFVGPMKVTISTNEPNAKVHYTTDGTSPTSSSELYKEPFTIETTTLVKARAYSETGAPSFVTEKLFGFDYMQSVSFSRKPNTPYNKDSDHILFDGETGSVDDLTRGWLGFSGTGVDIQFELSKAIDVSQIILGFAHNPSVWVFAPNEVAISTSTDGIHFSEPTSATISYNPADADMQQQKITLEVPIDNTDVKYIKVSIKTLGRIPDWHRAKGLKPWLLTDEITVTEKLKE
ncbi:MAG: chitobiase/beta-hexosaminidase C-terminal domain-containing protein [Bacteroidales bacterium]|nr:chitobiase/beta-hexosaminidase C-terminal domain-containing protein [Bacteroidales bacterium]